MYAVDILFARPLLKCEQTFSEHKQDHTLMQLYNIIILTIAAETFYNVNFLSKHTQ